MTAHGPKLTQRGQATRERIVTAAARLMYERGVAGTSTPDVRTAAGVSSSQIYHYFADKSALTMAVIEQQTEMILRRQNTLLDKLDSFEGLWAWRDCIVDLVRELGCAGGCPLGSLTTELADHDPRAREALAAGFSRWGTAIRDGLRTMIDLGRLSPDADPDHLSLAMLAALQGGLLLAQAQHTTAALEAGLDAMIERIACHAVPT
ncbi:TetR family transcriptional regulator [Actinosynnema sp. ALI-1.44]|uniref:TetR/AcrR family transcriptional regulator n=1 Tax=Actinosynnema sp. ALI-1.44 TaxID=1933779 RepID=UPI00097BF077|nr:TetR/AcrR family transcriptional regulator [Actinosynnema sp. ALI-1.44]ONI87082.1 TetR family transcriptional regulator [Actinosynnema sp. ALI-1.44]